MSFRGRLTLFFLLIVVLPMVAVAILVTQVTSQSGSGKADARLAEALGTTLSLYRDDVKASEAAAKQAAHDPGLAAALGGRDASRIDAVGRQLARDNGLQSLVIRGTGGERVATVGTSPQVAGYGLNLTARDTGKPLGSLSGSTTSASAFLAEVHRLTGRDGALLASGDPIDSTRPLGGATLPATGDSADVTLDGDDLRAATADLPRPASLQITLFGPVESGGFFSSSPLVAAVLVVFFAVALVFVAMLLRALAGQVHAMLDAARGIGQGDFSLTVPVVGKDEMAGLASEFNKMSGRLSEQMAQLRRQQVEIDRSVRRIGEAFASGLDRQALLEIVAETAVSACGADYGLIALVGREGAEAVAGSPTEPVQDAALAAERQASSESAIAEVSQDFAYAMSAPLYRIGERGHPLGFMTVARGGEPFSATERDVFVYLIGQAAASIENIALHELVSEQAVTDELTGLSNNRRFRELLGKEAARAERFGHELSLLMLDIDDFKQVNDTHGHLQGDVVLRMIGRVLSSESRGVDEPARYGGEEFVVALPETGLEGALELGERIRARIEAQAVAKADGGGAVRVTASLGAATMPTSAGSARELVAAADAALYEAKRAGKNRVEAAPAVSAAGRS